MNESSKNKVAGKKRWILIGAAIIVVAAAGLFLVRRTGGQAGTAYVDTVASLTGQGNGLGITNRFAGTVESQETWSVNKNSDVEVEEIYVKVGQTVEEGEILFRYDITKYEEERQEAEIELERMNNEYESIKETLAQLEKDKQKASASEQGNYTIQIKEQELALKDKELDIKLKEGEFEKLSSNIEGAEVASAISGVVKSINDGTSSDENEESGFITVMKVGDYRVKGLVSEQNISEVAVGGRVTVYSRVNDDTWSGKISKVDTENPESNNNYYGNNGSNKGSRYPFYVELDSSEGLIMGQHVYIEPAKDEANKGIKGIWVDEYLIDQTDPEQPFVWKDVNGRIRKQKVKLGDVNEEIGQVQVLEGLALTDSIAIPSEMLKEGMVTASMDEMPAENAGEYDTGRMTAPEDEEFNEREEFGDGGSMGESFEGGESEEDDEQMLEEVDSEEEE